MGSAVSAVLARPMSTPQHRTMNSVQRGNDSVLNVLTGEPSPSQSYPATSTDTSPAKEDMNSQPGSANASIKPDDPFAAMPDPFADISGDTFDDVSPEQPKKKEKEKKKVTADDPFANMGGSAFDDPMMSAPPATNKQSKSKAKPKAKAK